MVRKKLNIPYNQMCCKDCARLYHREWMRMNMDRQREKNEAWARKNPEKYRAMRKRYYWKNREKMLQYHHGYYYSEKGKQCVIRAMRKKNQRDKLEQDLEIQLNPLLPILKPYFRRRSGKTKYDNPST